jgi:tetratricopeptide (TPR) repeat protein
MELPFRVSVVFLLLLSVAAPWIHPQTATPEPLGEERRYDQAWLEQEAADRDARAGDYGAALRRYARALEMKPRFPEAFVGMARIYRSQSDILLAERYYLEALRSANQLEIPDQKYAIRIELATMYDETRLGREDLRKYRDQLLTIIEDDDVFTGTELPGQREMMFRTLLESGLNRVIVLYRLDFPQALDAHRRYARYLLEETTGSQRHDAAEHLLFSIVEVAGRAVDAVIGHEFDYQFSSVSGLYQKAQQYEPILDYLRNEGLVELLRDLHSVLTMLPDRRGASTAEEIQEELRRIEALR